MTAEPIVGLFGKVPARGDFIRTGLPRDFIDPWDQWLQLVLSDSRERMQQDWLPAWLEAPVWRFRLAPAICGWRSVLGLMLPSVDRAGRYFPLTLAAVADSGAPASGSETEYWLDACESAGRAALDQDLLPVQIAGMLPPPPRFDAGDPSGTAWWTTGGPRVPASRLSFPGMPDASAFVPMLDAGWDARTAGALP